MVHTGISAKYLMFYDNKDGAQYRKDPNGLVDHANGFSIDLGKDSEFYTNSCMYFTRWPTACF